MALTYEDGEYDLVTCRIAPHHFPDCARFVREMARVLRQGGVAAAIDNVVPEDIAAARHINVLERLRNPTHNRAYTAADWLDFFAAAGLDVTRSEIFRKPRDCDCWSDMMGVDGKRREQLRVVLLEAPTPARETIASQLIGGALKFYLADVLVIADRSR